MIYRYIDMPLKTINLWGLHIKAFPTIGKGFWGRVLALTVFSAPSQNQKLPERIGAVGNTTRAVRWVLYKWSGYLISIQPCKNQRAGQVFSTENSPACLKVYEWKLTQTGPCYNKKAFDVPPKVANIYFWHAFNCNIK